MQTSESPPEAGKASAERLLVIHYGELALKGRNRSTFENRLLTNLRELLAGLLTGHVERPRGRLLLHLSADASAEEALRRLGLVYGIANYSLAERCSLDLDDMTQIAVALARRSQPKTIAIRCRRSEKVFPLRSIEVNRHVGGAVVEATGAGVDLDDPGLEIRIDLLKEYGLVYARPVPGAGGLPVGCEGRAVALLSGGIDSPVAAELMMKRGCRMRFVHFHSEPFTSIESREKVVELARILATRQGRATVDAVPFAAIQQEIIARSPASYRVLLYRRFMIRIATEIARKRDALALVTGESLGQVASQTLHNLAAIAKVAELPILRPLVGYDKQEIITRARQIETYELSIQPHDDCCSFMMPSRVATRASAADLEQAEADLDVAGLVQVGLDGVTSEEVQGY